MKKLILFSSITLALVAPLLADEVIFIQNFENNSEDIGDTDLGKAIAEN